MVITKNKHIHALVFILLLLFLTSCQSESSQDNRKNDLTIYTSIYPLQFLTESITDGVAHVQSIYPPGVDAHTYEPTLKEMTSIAKANMFIFFGEGMESFSEKVAQSLKSESLHLIEIGKYEQLFSAHDGIDIDPHIWLDPLRMIEMGKIIKNELVLLYPEYDELFSENLDELSNNLTLLDEQFLTMIEGKKDKEIIVSHAAYGYWEERYDISQLPVSGLISTDEPSQNELVQIVKEIREKNLQYIIFDQTGEHRLSTIIQHHTNTKKRMIHDLEVLTEENINKNEDYISLMEQNIQTLDEVTR